MERVTLLQFFLIFIILIFDTCSSELAGGKYAGSLNNQNHDLETKPFRMNKINMIWEKAGKRLDEVKLGTLYTELKIQDKLEITLKRKLKEGGDESGEEQAMVRRQFLDITRKYGLHTGHPNIIENKSIKDPHLNENMDPAHLDFLDLKFDKRLNHIWLKAKETGFSREELNDLKEELKHHQDKLKEMKMIENEINQLPGRLDENENELPDFASEDNFLKNGKKLNQPDLEETSKDVYDGIAETERKVAGKGYELPQFEETRVSDLWSLAKKANFSDIELQSFKEELHHFEHRVKKHKILQENSRQETGHPNDSGTSDRRLKRDHEVLQYGRTVEKYHEELKHRLSKAMRHHEL